MPASHWRPTAEIALPRFTCGGLLRRGAELVPDRVALVDACGEPADGMRRRWTYSELLADAERLARRLLEDLQPGDRVAVWAPSSAAWLLSDLAIALAGLVLVPVNPAYRRAEAEHVLRAARPAAVLHGRVHRGIDLAAMAADLTARVGEVRRVADLEAFVHDALRARPSDAPLPEVGLDAPAQVQFTSGTTGAPKGVVLHHGGLAGMPAMSVELMELGEAPVWLNVMPLHHIGGCGLSTLGPMAALGTQVLADRFTAAGALALIEEESVTVMGSVPTMLLAMLDHPERAARDLSSLRVVISGGAAVSAALIGEIERELSARVVVAFGQTESHGHITQTRPADSDADKAETCGRPLPNVEVKLVDADGATVPLGAIGEVCTRSALLMSGYLDDPAATAAAIDPDGFLHTGDLCTMDARGYLRFVGRAKDMIVRGGENIAPREIEDRLREHPGVADVAVIGVPDARLGEAVAAVVRPVDDAPSIDELQRWVGEALAAFKVPVHWRFVTELPTTANGKVHKPTLRATWEAVST